MITQELFDGKENHDPWGFYYKTFCLFHSFICFVSSCSLFVREDNDEDGEEDGSDSQNSLDTFIVENDDEEQEEGNSPSFYAEADRAITVLPYFPLAFAKSKDEPLKFNFDLALLDSLELPCPILGPGEVTVASNDTKLTFTDRKEAVQYCQQKLAPWRDQARCREQAPQTLERDTRWTMFTDEGRSLESFLKCGVQDLDEMLYRVREDR